MSVIPQYQAQALIESTETWISAHPGSNLGTQHDELVYYAKSVVSLHQRVAELTHHQEEERRLRDLLWDYGLAHDVDSPERLFSASALFSSETHLFGFEDVRVEGLDFEVWLCRYCNHLVHYRAQHRETCNA